MPIVDSESTMSLDGTKPEEKTPPHHAGKVGGLGDSAKPPKLYAHHINGMAGEQLIE